jgi:peptide/nickel transport system substrate-binding protein
MNKEPIGLYIFRYIVGFGLFLFMAMLYWSSALIEQDLKFLRSDIMQLKGDLLSLRASNEKTREEVIKALAERPSIPQKTSQAANEIAQTETFPNLLKPDRFYQETLPELLGPDFIPRGTRRQAVVGKPHNLHVFGNWSMINTWIGWCSVSTATQEFGKFETMAPEMATRIELRQNQEGLPEYWVFLRQDVFWAPLQQSHFSTQVALAPHFLEKHQVTAHDFKFYFDAIMNPHMQEPGAVALKTYLGDIEEFKVIDDFTFVVRWKIKEVEEAGKKVSKMKYMSKGWTGALRPLASFVYKYFSDGTKIIPNDSDPNTYRTNPIWAQNFAHHWANNIIVSCGPWLFDGMTEREIRFKRNPDYFNPYAALAERIEVQFKDSPDGIWEQFKSGALDSFQVPPNQMSELDRFLDSLPYKKQKQKGLKINQLEYVDRAYTYIGWNQTRPFFKSKKVRQALTMAIDRQRIIQQYLNGMGIEITGTFYRYSPSYDASLIPWPFDPLRARALLEEEGWYDRDGTGIISKVIDGQKVPFQFVLSYYVKNPTSKSICEYISTVLKEIGIACTISGLDLADLSSLFDDKNFDALCLGWALGTPPEDPKQLWYSTGAKEKGSSNAVGFTNKEADQIIDQLEYEYNQQKRIELYHRFDAILHEEAPYTFLYTPKALFVYRDYLQNVFIPSERQDLIPGANVAEPDSSIFWIKEIE